MLQTGASAGEKRAAQVSSETTNSVPAVIELVTVTGRPANPISSAPAEAERLPKERDPRGGRRLR